MDEKDEKIIWVIEDERGLRTLLSNVFSQNGYDVRSFENADQALKCLRERESPYPHAVFCDFCMIRGRNGIEFYEAAGQYLQKTVKYIMTGFPKDKLGLESLQDVKVFEKPLEMPDVMLELEDDLGALADKAMAEK